MRYISTRGRAPELGFDDVLLAGLAADGGLYVPAAWPSVDTATWRRWSGLSYAELAAEVMAPFVAGSVAEAALPRMCADAYAGFSHRAVAPLVQIGPNRWLLELFHGPTLAFKDFALQIVGRLFDHVLGVRKGRVTIVGATSGDTGSAAIEAIKGRATADIFLLHPFGRVSDVQRKQMTTVDAANVHNIAIDGTFDDCQNLVKAMFADAGLRDEVNLSAVNSINWARIMAQVVYYVWAALSLGGPHRSVAFSVPTGNFGNVFAGFVAQRMGLPVTKFIVGSNSNDILTRYFETGVMSSTGVVPTLSPSMDIQISSNFERLLFETMGRDGAAVSRLMDRFKQSGAYDVPEGAHRAIAKDFLGRRLDDEGTRRTIADVYRATGIVIDPHTAVGVAAAAASGIASDVPVITMATAHPAKFPDAVEAAIGVRPPVPGVLAGLAARTERVTRLANDLDKVKSYVRTHARR